MKKLYLSILVALMSSVSMFADVTTLDYDNSNVINSVISSSLFNHKVTSYSAATTTSSGVIGSQMNPYNSQLATGVNHGILLSADALVHTTANLSVSTMNPAAMSTTTYADGGNTGGGIVGIGIPTDSPIGVETSVGNGVAILCILLVSYAIVFYIRRKDWEKDEI